MSMLEVSRSIALSHPLAALSFLAGNRDSLHSAMIHRAARHLLGKRYRLDAWTGALEEAEGDGLIPPDVPPGRELPPGNSHRTTFGKWLYCSVRALRPSVVVETGVAHGVSSWLILNALHKNGSGILHSIDLPDRDTDRGYNPGEERWTTGWVVPGVLRERWQLKLGPVREMLPSLLAETEGVDIFFHDSDHSYENMMFEFSEALRHMKATGIIISDDIRKNRAFEEFVQKEGLRAVAFRKGGCAAAQR